MNGSECPRDVRPLWVLPWIIFLAILGELGEVREVVGSGLLPFCILIRQIQTQNVIFTELQGEMARDMIIT